MISIHSRFNTKEGEWVNEVCLKPLWIVFNCITAWQLRNMNWCRSYTFYLLGETQVSQSRLWRIRECNYRPYVSCMPSGRNSAQRIMPPWTTGLSVVLRVSYNDTWTKYFPKPRTITFHHSNNTGRFAQVAINCQVHLTNRGPFSTSQITGLFFRDAPMRSSSNIISHNIEHIRCGADSVLVDPCACIFHPWIVVLPNI